MPEKLAVLPPPAASLRLGQLSLTLDELAMEPVRPVGRLFGPILDPTITLIHAPPGVGKTLFSYEIALAVATGESEFARASLPGWQVGSTGPVLIVDGELPLDELRRRLVFLRGRRRGFPIHLISNAQLHDADEPMLDISRPQARAALSELVEETGAKLVILDNLATLTGQFYDEDGAGAQRALNSWQAGLRQDGVSVILIHHDNKSGAQRGSSDRETICDLILHLTRVNGATVERASFDVGFGKARFLAMQPTPFSARLEDLGNWSFATAETTMLTKLVAHMEAVEEWNWKDVATDLGDGRPLSKAYVFRLQKEAEAEGLWQPGWGAPKRRKRTPMARS